MIQIQLLLFYEKLLKKCIWVLIIRKFRVYIEKYHSNTFIFIFHHSFDNILL